VRDAPSVRADDGDDTGGAATATGADGAAVAAAATATGAGAMPQTEQNPSSIVPAHPGRLHAVIRRTPSL
jgi:hypothetical protein